MIARRVRLIFYFAELTSQLAIGERDAEIVMFVRGLGA